MQESNLAWNYLIWRRHSEVSVPNRKPPVWQRTKKLAGVLMHCRREDNGLVVRPQQKPNQQSL
jgi:hypothetical protein